MWTPQEEVFEWKVERWPSFTATLEHLWSRTGCFGATRASLQSGCADAGVLHASAWWLSPSVSPMSQRTVQLGSTGNSQGKHLYLLSRETILQHTTESSMKLFFLRAPAVQVPLQGGIFNCSLCCCSGFCFVTSNKYFIPPQHQVI